MIFGHSELAQSLTNHHMTPNWRDAADYRYLARRDNDQIAWEFLRRNSEYREAFFQWLPLWQRSRASGRTEDIAELDAACTTLCERFGLVEKFGPRHPASLIHPTFQDCFRPNVQVLAHRSNGHELNFYDPPPPDSLNNFDVRIVAERPLEEQLERISILYKEMVRGIRRPTNPKLDASKYTIYLRILDALNSGAKLPEIVRGLHPEEVFETAYERVKKQKSAALAFAAKGYLEIVRPRF